MRFTTLLALSSTFLAPVFGQALQSEIDMTNPGEHSKGQYVDTDTISNRLRYLIDYKFVGREDVGEVLSIFNGDEITLNYTFANHEDQEISIVGVGGQFLDPMTGENKANITDARLGPLTIVPGAEVNFQQRISINLSPNNYVLVPGLYILQDTSLALIGTKTTLAIISDRPVSLLNPQFLVLELLLLALIGGAGYYGYEYFNKTDASKAGKKKSKTIAKSAGKASGVNSEWLPEHIKKTNQRKVK